MYYFIKKYCDAIDDFQLYFTFAKHNKLWKYIYPRYKEDVLQIIALACLENNTLKSRNNSLQRELYYFYNKVIINYRLPKKNIKKKNKNKKYPDYYNKCDFCKDKKKEYMHKSFIPGKTICSKCRRRHERKYK